MTDLFVLDILCEAYTRADTFDRMALVMRGERNDLNEDEIHESEAPTEGGG